MKRRGGTFRWAQLGQRPLKPCRVCLGVEQLEPIIVPNAAIMGEVWADANNNNIIDNREQGIQGVSVTLNGTSTVITNSTGGYQFPNLAPFSVQVTDQGGSTTSWGPSASAATAWCAWPAFGVRMLGDLILDRYTWGDAERVSPEAPVLILRADEEEVRLGGAASVAGLLRGLEAEVVLAGVIGDDGNGRVLRHLLEEAGIDRSAVFVDRNRPTTTKDRFMGRAAQRHPQQILVAQAGPGGHGPGRGGLFSTVPYPPTAGLRCHRGRRLGAGHGGNVPGRLGLPGRRPFPWPTWRRGWKWKSLAWPR